LKGLTNPHQPGCPWHKLASDYGHPVVKYCEETLCSWISEPANTWSNLGFLVCAIVLYKWSRGKDPLLRYFPWAMLIMGAGSFYYHMSNTYITQIADYIGMYVMVYWFVVINLRRLGISMKTALFTYVGLSVLSQIGMHAMFLARMNYQMIIVFAGLIVAVTEVIANKKETSEYSMKNFWLGIAFIIFAQFCSILDAKGIVCDPHNHFIQGHGLWHIFSGIGLTIMYKHWAQFFPLKPHSS